MVRRTCQIVIPFGLLALGLAGLLFADGVITGSGPEWLRLILREIQAACRDAGTQWMVVVCLTSYFVTFLVLAWRFKFQVSSFKPGTDRESQVESREWEGLSLSSTLHPPSSARPRAISYLLTAISSPDFWLVTFVALVLLRYAFDYSNAAKSLQVVVLLTGLVVGKGFALWAGAARRFKFQVSSAKLGETDGGNTSSGVATFSPSDAEKGLEAERVSGPTSILHLPSSPRRLTILGTITFLLAGAALWHPERGMEFQYRGQPRWTGPWDNPNLFGVLMGVGVILAVGLLVSSCRLQVAGCKSPISCSSRISRLKILLPILLLSAAGLCAFGLLKSYSRGAWLGTAVGFSFLLFQVIKFQVSSVDAGRMACLRRRFWFPSSILIFSLLVICFWQFRHTEAPLARRVFSVGNPNDFSWRNRVAAWEGAGRMMLAKPLIGFGWGKAEEVYSKEYRAARLEESAAIQMNDFLMIGISAGVPALACLLGYLFLRGFQVLSFKFQARQAETLDLGLKPLDFIPTICFAGAIVGMVGFWFDGGLFKLPTCVVFWGLVELGRAGFLTANDAKDANAEGGASVRASRLVSSLAPPIQCGAQRTARPTIVLRWLAAITALGALGLTTLHLGTPQLTVSERTLSIARKFLVPPGEKTDFEFLAARPIWSNTPLQLLLQHAHLANYNRTLVNWKLDEQMYREFVLSPEPNLQPATFNIQLSTDSGWRRPLWEHFYPRIRKESSLEAAAEIVVRHLNEVCGRRGDESHTEKAEFGSQKPEMAKSIAEIWQQREASDAEFARVCVAAWRAVGIPARLVPSGQAEFWNGTEWKAALQPVEASSTNR